MGKIEDLQKEHRVHYSKIDFLGDKFEAVLLFEGWPMRGIEQRPHETKEGTFQQLESDSLELSMCENRRKVRETRRMGEETNSP